MTRPYALAWDFSVLSLTAATMAKRRRIFWTGIFFGLAVASRVESLTILPVLIGELYSEKRGKQIIPCIAFAALVAVAVSPWLTINLIGNLRSIAVVRFTTPGWGHTPWSTTLYDFAIRQGAAPAILLIFLGVFRARGHKLAGMILLTLFWLALLADMLHERGYGIHQHAPLLIIMLLLLAMSGPALEQFPTRWAWGIIALVLGFPMLMTILQTVHDKRMYADDRSFDWDEQNIPTGTRVYVSTYSSFNSLLPTRQASDFLWGEVTDASAPDRKFALGLKKFNLSVADIPRALSEDEMDKDRGNKRMFYILGTRPNFPAPRYDLRIVGLTPYDTGNLKTDWQNTGGVVIWSNQYSGVPIPDYLGKPAASFVNHYGNGTFVFVSPATQPSPTTQSN